MKRAVIIAGMLIIIVAVFLIGFAVGSKPAASITPAECGEALQYAERLFQISSVAVDKMADGQWTRDDLAPLTDEVNSISPQYRRARAACLREG